MRRFIRSINGKLLLLLIATLFPILVIAVLLLMQEEQQQYQRLLEAERRNIEFSASSVNSSIRLLDEQLTHQILTGSSDFGRLESRELGGTQNNLDYYPAVFNVKKQMDAINAAFPYIESTFLYYPAQELFIYGKRTPEVSEHIRGFAEDTPGKTSSGWISVPTENGWYGLNIYYLRHGYIGSWFSYNGIADYFLRQEGENRAFVATGDGIVLAGDASQGSVDISELLQGAENAKADYVISRINCLDVYLVRFLDDGAMGTKSTFAFNTSIAIIFLLLLDFFLVVVGGILLFVQRPIKRLTVEMEKLSEGNLDYRITDEKGFSTEFSDISHRFNEMLDTISEAKIQIYQQELEQTETKLRYLSQQIQPHFILNSLNTVYNYCRRDVETTRKIILLLVAYYRYVVNVESNYVLLHEELSHIENYLSLQKIRMDDRLTYRIECPSELKTVRIPPFLIESFISNALKYGANEDDCIAIDVLVAKEPGSKLSIRIMDHGEGFPDEILEAIGDISAGKPVPEGLGIGIRNSIERLKLLYRDGAEIALYNDEGAVVRIEIGLERGGRGR